MRHGETGLPERFRRTVRSTWGEPGAQWLVGLPALLEECARRWSLTLAPPFPNLTFHYVAPAVRADGTEAVLKAGVPNKELRSEAAALRVFDGRGSVRLLDSDPDRGLLLLERLRPGAVLTALADEAHDDEATTIAASVMRGLWRPAPPGHDFPTVADWGESFARLRARFGGGTGPLPAAQVERAETLFAELLASSAPPVLLHGDLHHDNILSAQRQPWLAIDPKGVVGEPAYEVGALLRNLWPERHTNQNPARMLERRAHRLAEELGIDPVRVRDWAVAQAVLSAVWGVEDSDDGWEGALANADILAAIPVCNKTRTGVSQ
jgi:streptomycin 6-kinase